GEPGGDGGRLDRLELGVQLLEVAGADGELRGLVMLADLTGHAHRVADRDVADGLRRVDEHGGGAFVAAEVQLPAGAAGLDDIPAQPAGGVHRGDDALGGDVLPLERAGRSGALDLGDRDSGGVDGLLAVARVLAVAGVAGVAGVTGISEQLPGGGRADLEVGAVLTGRGDPLDGGAVGGARGGGLTGEGDRTTPAHQVDHGRVLGAGGAVALQRASRVRQGAHPTAAGGVGGAGGGRLGARLAVPAAGGELDQEPLPGADDALEGQGVVEGPGGRGVLQRPAVDAEVVLGSVDQLDEVVLENGTGVAPAAIDLLDLE